MTSIRRKGRRFEELASLEALRHDFAEFVEFYRWRICGSEARSGRTLKRSGCYWREAISLPDAGEVVIVGPACVEPKTALAARWATACNSAVRSADPA